MKKKVWITSAVLAGLVLIGGLIFAGYAIYSFVALAGMVIGEPYEATQVNAYVKDKTGRTVEILKRNRKTGNPRYKEVLTVKTMDRQGVKFLIRIGQDGMIANNNFLEMEPGYDATARYDASPEVQELKKRGFRYISIGNGTPGHGDDLTMQLPEGTPLSSEKAPDVLWEALPIIRALDKRITDDTGYQLDQLNLNGKRFDLKDDFDDLEALGRYMKE